MIPDCIAIITGAGGNGCGRSHILMENRDWLLVQTFLTEANGRAERDAAMLMAETIPGGKRVTGTFISGLPFGRE
jgi:hypothetical protein